MAAVGCRAMVAVRTPEGCLLEVEAPERHCVRSAPGDDRTFGRGDRAPAPRRNDALDGLRFVAVAAVLAFHFGVPGAQAGFLGVDLFFVLSGFLITSILLSQVERGRVRVGDFWTRRIRRLAPAVLVALAVVIAWGALEASMTSRDALRGDVTATLAYVANWHFIASSSYFQATGDQSPLLHMWTLAVEEQFYVLWPLTLLLIALIIPRRARLTVVAAVAAAGVLTSAWRLHSLWMSSGSSDRAYMGTDSRMFGPLVGALIAVALIRAPKLGDSHWANAALLLASATILVWAMFVLGSADGPSGTYPAGGALLFALASAALIWAVSTRVSRVSSLLALPPIAYLGRISYGIYLWHWLFIVWAEKGWIDLSGLSPVARGAALTTATIAAASLSFHLVEKPIRYGSIGAHLNGKRVAVVLPAAVGTLIAVNTAVVVPHAGAEFSPVSRGAPRAVVTKTLILVGDSVPQLLGQNFADAAAKYDYVVLRATSGGCPATGVEKVYASGKRFRTNGCPKVVREQDREIERYRPALVIWWSRYEVAPRLGQDQELLPLGSRAYWEAQQASFEDRARALTRRGARLVTVQIERPGRALAARDPSERELLVGQTLLHRMDIVRTWNTFLSRHRGPKVFSLSIERMVCQDTRNPCEDSLPNGRTARPDGVHYSAGAGPRLASQILEAALRIAGLQPEPDL
jgi:peptidoglycan/LPS O-acetylase OafA/YrhL